MICKTAEYKVKRCKIAQAEQAIRQFVAAILSEEPATVYTVYQKADGRSFIHVMAFADQAAEKRHQRAPYTLRFVEALYPNCEEEPSFTDLTLIQSSGPGT